MPGVIDDKSGKRYRLKTLGVLEELEARRRQWEEEKERLKRTEERMALLAKDREKREKGKDKGLELGRGREDGLGLPKFKE